MMNQLQRAQHVQDMALAAAREKKKEMTSLDGSR
jgi:hypothetical protein